MKNVRIKPALDPSPQLFSRFLPQAKEKQNYLKSLCSKSDENGHALLRLFTDMVHSLCYALPGSHAINLNLQSAFFAQ